eukprot:gene5598-6163_t
MKNLKEEELEFISVSNEDDHDMMMSGGHYVDPLAPERSNSTIGHWLFNQSKHPSALFFHLLFKSLAIALYIFGSWVTSSFIFTFVLCVILLAFDFWTVKNVSGRLLVGLRWWSYVKEDGSNEWIFESLEDMAEISSFDSTVFWGSLYLTPLAWTLLFIIGLLRLKFEYLPIVIAAIVMSMANIIGYFKCSNSAKKKVQNMMERGVQQGAMSALENSTLRNWALNTLLAITTSNSNTGSGDHGNSRTSTVV